MFCLYSSSILQQKWVCFSKYNKPRESWCKYKNTFIFNETINSPSKHRTKIEVCSTYNLIYDGIVYMNNEEITMDNTLEKSFSVEELTNTTKIDKEGIAYENLICNKKETN